MSTGAYRTQQVSGHELREDLMDTITDLSPTETPLFTGLQNSTARSTFHQWLTDSVPRATSVSTQIEGFDVSFSDLTPPDRVTNYVQGITQSVKVSDIVDRSETAGGNSFANQKKKAFKTLKLKAEYALINGTGNSGASGVAAEMTGLRKAITTNYVSFASGTTLTEARFNDVLQLAYNDVTDQTMEAYFDISLKRVVSAFTSGATKFIESKDRRLISAVDVYESDVAKMVKLFAHRDVTSSNPNKWFFAIQPKAFAKAMMIEPEWREYPSQGVYKAGFYTMAMTLEYRYEKAAVRAEGLSVF